MARRKFSFLFLSIFLLANSFELRGGVLFSDPDISGDNRILFRMEYSDQEALFVSGINDKSISRMTAFPERIDLIDNGRTLLVRNAFGPVKIPVSGGLPGEGFPSFAGFEKGASGSCRINETAVSPDGRWMLALKPDTPAYGTLVLSDMVTGESIVIAAGIERPEKEMPVSWSPDSQAVIYSRSNKLYYCMVNQNLLASRFMIDEKFRLIGEGTLNSVYWDRNDIFYYARGSVIYRVRAAELFTRSLYADFLEIGSMAGKIPFEFDPRSDKFLAAPDGGSVLLLKGGRGVYFYPLDNSGYSAAMPGLPSLVLPRSCFEINVLWSPEGGITVLASVWQGQAARVTAWRLDPGSNEKVFIPLNPPSGKNAALSPDGKTVLVWGAKGIDLYDYVNWKLLAAVSSRPASACLWIGNNEIITGDDEYIERVILFPGDNGRIISREVICLSKADRFGFEITPDNGNAARILAFNSGGCYVTDGKTPWTEIANPQLRPSSQVSDRYRVYLEKQNSSFYENLPMIRNVESVGTFTLVPPAPEIMPGSRKETALCFDLYDDAEGLPHVLQALDRLRIKATFFLGGEFIRRYPDAANDIAAAGHEAASLFFAPIDLTDSRYQIDGEFIARGLARNEDEYFNATGSELALLWHPPWYANSGQAASAAAKAGYATINRDVDPYDWVSPEDEKNTGLVRLTAAEMTDRIISLAGSGSIIPVRLGFLPGRADYLFQRINVLLDALIAEGFSVVTVSQLIGNTD